MGFISKQISTTTTNVQNNFILLVFLHWFIFIIYIKANAQRVANHQQIKAASNSSSVSAIFVFGDSTSDPGNNNFITTPFKGNFPPYGQDFTNQIPTGRFSNGLLCNDFVARYVGVKDYVPPYLDPSLSSEELMSGVSFASAGSGFDPLTPAISNVISVSKQLEYFKEYQERMQVVIGKRRTKQVIRNALFIVSAGTNDFVINYYTLPIRRRSYDIHAYMDFLLLKVQQLIQDLWDEGARRIAVAGLSPMGCLPIVITFVSDNPVVNRGCVEDLNSVAREYNNRLQFLLNSMQLSLSLSSPSRITYMDTYTPMADIITGTLKLEFDVVSSGCCGTGIVEATFLCNKQVVVCPNASRYVFWDSMHPTETAYYLAFKAFQPTIDSILDH